MTSLLLLGLATAPLDDSQLARVIDFRHWSHANPELSNHETQTAKRLAQELTALGLEVETGLARTGVIALLKGGKPGPLVAVRADMDALPVKETTGLPWASRVVTDYNGQPTPVAHACGHDVHMSVGLGTAMALTARRDELQGTVLFIFQPAEEGSPPGMIGGAELMLQEGLFRKYRPEAIFALHTFPEMNVGELGYTPGPAFAATDHFILKVHGKQAHGSRPHQGVDPIVMSAEIITALQSIRSRTLDPSEPAVLSIGSINGGERFNIIPETVTMEGTVRTYSAEWQDVIIERMHAIANGISKAHGGSYELVYDKSNPALINDPALAQWSGDVLQKHFGADHVSVIPPTMGGEDFAFFAREIPGFYFRLGTNNPEHPSGGLHTPDFRADDAAIPVGVAAISTLVTEYLAGKPAGRK